MGIPLVYEPPSSRSEQNPKPDPTAVSRSPIRRQGAIRRARARVNASRNSTSRNNHGLPPYSYLSHLADHLHHRLHHGSRDSDSERPRPSRVTRSPMSRDALHWAPLSPNVNRREANNRSLRDSIRHLSDLSAMRMEAARTPWSIEDVSNSATPTISPPNHPFRTAHRPSLTPGFAPAHPLDPGIFARVGDLSSTMDDDSTIEGTMDASMPLLRRVGHRSVTSARGSRSPHPPVIDGLGDRDRSVGLDDDNDIQDTWERLLTTIPPDDHLPSAESSFASATATASNSLSRNNRRSNSTTSTTTPASSFGTEAPPPHILFGIPELSVHCEGETDNYDTETGSDQEAEQSQPRITPRRRSEARPSNIRLSSERDRDTSGQQHFDNDTPTASAGTSFSTDNILSDLQQVHRILDHLVRRDDIPDEWWATAGLSRTVRRELNDTNNRSADA